MSGNSPKSLADLLFRPGGALAALVRRAEESLSLVARLKAGLEPGAGEALRAARLTEDGTLVIAVASPAWAARLRFDTERLQQICLEGQLRCERVEVRVAGPDEGSS